MPHIEIPSAYEWRPSYPHMSPLDKMIWDRFIHSHPDKFLRVWYDFRIGDEDPIPEDLPASVRSAWFDLSYWRVDVIGETKDSIFVIEVKPFANSKAIGQALGYAAIFKTDEMPGLPVVPVVITDRIFPTTQRVADALDVELWTP